MQPITRYSQRTIRFRHTIQMLNAFIQSAQANTDRDVEVQFQDAYDKFLSGLTIDDDFPAVAVPAWSAFKSRYFSDVTGGLVESATAEDAADVVRDAIEFAM